MEDRQWVERQRFHLGNNREVFEAEVFAIYQALGTFEAGQETSRRYRIFSNCRPAVRRVMADALGATQHCARACIEVGSRFVAAGSEIGISWVPAHSEVEGNEIADDIAKKAAEGSLPYKVLDGVRWQASPPHLSRRDSEGRAGQTPEWVASHGRPERRYRPPGGTGLRREALRRARKALAGRHYQLLLGHTVIGSFLHERMTEALRLELSECRWCGSGERESRHDLFMQCPGLDPSDPEVVEEDGKELRVKASKGAGGEKAVEGHRGCSGVSGGGIGWQAAAGGESAQGGGGGRG